MIYKRCSYNNIGLESVILVERQAYIPFDPANTDYQAYLEWISEGNTPLPPDGE